MIPSYPGQKISGKSKGKSVPNEYFGTKILMSSYEAIKIQKLVFVNDITTRTKNAKHLGLNI